MACFARIAQLKRLIAELISVTSIALLQTKQQLSVIGIFGPIEDKYYSYVIAPLFT
ncbi:6837_t:CDS:2, partial [Gigaspora margarita]